MEANGNEYNNEYSEKSFWEKLKNFAIAAGREVIEKALTLYYVLQDADTPKWAKTVIIGALGYFIMPLDAIPDITPVVGYADDLGVLVSAIATVGVHVKPEHVKQAQDKIREWFK